MDMSCLPNSTRHPFLVARSLVKKYGARTALDHVDFAVGNGEVIAVMGRCGAGKTTLVRVLTGILQPDHGAVLLDGHRLDHLGEARRNAVRCQEFGLIAQDGALIDELTVEENVALPLVLRGSDRDEALVAAREWLDHLELRRIQRQYPDVLSAAHGQFVTVARALVGHPKMVFADDPTDALGNRAAGEVVEALLRSAARAGAAVVVTTRCKEVAAHAQRSIEIRDGRFVGGVLME